MSYPIWWTIFEACAKFLVQIFARKSHFWPTFNRVQFDPTWLYLFINAKLHEKRLYLSVDGFSSALLTLISSFLIFFFLLLLLRRLPSTTGENLPRHTHPHFHAFPAFFLFYLFFQEKFIQLLVFNFNGRYLPPSFLHYYKNSIRYITDKTFYEFSRWHFFEVNQEIMHILL